MSVSSDKISGGGKGRHDGWLKEIGWRISANAKHGQWNRAYTEVVNKVIDLDKMFSFIYSGRKTF